MNQPPFTPTQARSRDLLKRLAREYILPHRAKMLLGAFCMMLVAGTTAAIAYLMQPVLDDIFLKQQREMLVIIPVAVLAIFAIKAAAGYGENVVLQTMGQRIVATMQQQLYRHLIHADIALFADQASGKLISRFTNDIYLLRQSVSTVFTGTLKELLSLVFLIGVMVYQSWLLALIALTIFPLSALPIIRLGKRMRKISSATQENLSQFAGQLDETFAGVRLVKAYGQEAQEIGRAERHIEQLFSLYAKAARVQSAASPMMEMFTGLAIAAIIAYGGKQVMDGVTTPGAFFSFITAMIMAYKPAKVMAGFNNQLQEGLAAAARLFAVLDTPAQVTDLPEAKPLKVTEGVIRLDAVTFQYHSAAGTSLANTAETALPPRAGVEHISLTIPAGKTVALVGPSGGGKSTLMSLLLRFYDPQAGQITIDGQDIRHVTLESLRAATALVSQDAVLFDDTVAANIAYGCANATPAQIEEAAKAAAAHEFILQLPQGYDTPVGPRGAKLSGGQKQRLSIARALLKDAPILLLDEATSALDTQSEQQVQQALERLMRGRTTLVIAHRLSTIQHADHIYVMDQGRIVENGTHASLNALHDGLYQRLYAHNLRD